MKSDALPKKDVEVDLDWRAAVDAAHVGAVAHGGVEALGGDLRSDARECAATREAKGREVVVSGHSVAPMGQVHSRAEQAAAQGGARSAHGITSVADRSRVV